MKTAKNNVWRSLLLIIGAVALGLMPLSPAIAQKGHGGHGGGGGGRGGGGGSSFSRGGGGGNLMSAGSNFSRGGGNNLMSGGNYFSRGGGNSPMGGGGVQRIGGSMNFKQSSPGMNVQRGGFSSANSMQRDHSGGLSGNQNITRGRGAGSLSQSGGINGANSGSANFVQKNFGNASSRGGNNAMRSFGDTSGKGGGNTMRSLGDTGKIAKSPNGNSGFVSRNFADINRAKGNGKPGQKIENSGGGRSHGNEFVDKHGISPNNPKNNWDGNHDHNGWDGDHDHGDWDNDWDGHHHNDWHYYHKPFYGYANYGYYYPYNNWYWPLVNLTWGLTFGHGPWWYDNGYAYGGGYGGYSGYYDYSYPVTTTYYVAPVGDASVASIDPSSAAPNTGSAPEVTFAAQGEAAFKAGNYSDAARAFRHALVDDPNNGAYMMMLGQALFATGQFSEAAGATQQATQMLPQDKWGTIIANYAELYRSSGDYAAQLKALEQARNDKPNDPALHFLLGWHYGYLGFPAESVRELDKTLAMIPADKVAKAVRDAMAEKLPKEEIPPPKPAEKPTPSGAG